MHSSAATAAAKQVQEPSDALAKPAHRLTALSQAGAVTARPRQNWGTGGKLSIAMCFRTATHVVSQAPGGAHAHLQGVHLIQGHPQAPPVRDELLHDVQLYGRVACQDGHRTL